MTPQVPEATESLLAAYGPVEQLTIRPYAISAQAPARRAFIKLYRGIEPRARQERERYAVEHARSLGLNTPAVVDSGHSSDLAWTVFEMLDGTPCQLRTPEGVREFVERSTRFFDILHRSRATSAGPGWADGADRREIATSAHLLSQLSSRAREMPWWTSLQSHLRRVDDEPTVLLHGDIKPEHILIGDLTHVVDWEACQRSAAAVDHADLHFHLVRDLLYTGGPTKTPQVAVPPRFGAVLAWRVALWAGRRRPHDLELLPGSDLVRLSRAESQSDALPILVNIVEHMRRRRVPR